MLFHETTSYSSLRDDFETQFSRMSKAKQPTYVVRPGKATAVVMNAKEFETYAAAKEREEARLALEESLAQADAGLLIPWEQVKKNLRRSLRATTHSKPPPRR